MLNVGHKRVLDLFAGCGGLSLGFQDAGFDVVAAFDHWDAAIKVYQQNFAHPIYKLDLSTPQLDYSTFSQFNPDIMVGGPPCQDFSHAGKRNEELGRADLTISFAQIINYIKPDFFVMENVDRASKSKRLHVVRQRFKSAGYGLTERILDASLCGVPQRRKRLFVIGGLGLRDDFLGDVLDQNLAQMPLTVRDYFNQCLQISLDVEHYYRHPRNYSRRAIYSIDEPSATIRGVNRPIPATYVPHPADTAHPSTGVRPLTTLERSYIQTFPNSFLFSGTKSEVEQMIGNAVPVKLAEYVARALLNYLNYPCQSPIQLDLFQASTSSVSSTRSLV